MDKNKFIKFLENEVFECLKARDSDLSFIGSWKYEQPIAILNFLIDEIKSGCFDTTSENNDEEEF